ncbi:MAG: glycoside hydrolase family 2 TIM barrel-domain containing protein [Thermoleophilaceae bacterium]
MNFRARVYLNGREIGRHEGDDIPFEIPASKMKRGTNRLVVRVDNRRQAADFPGARDQASGAPGGGWWNYNGILREVYLRRVGTVDIVDFGVRPVLPCRRCAATAVVTATLRRAGGGRGAVRLNATVAGRRVPFREVGLPGRGTRQVSARVRIPNPRLWEPGSPELYRARASARRLDVPHPLRDPVLQRQPRGAHAAERSPGGAAGRKHPRGGARRGRRRSGPAQRAQIFNSLRDLGATVTRAHYPLHPSFYEMADRSGILIYNQIPFYQVGDQFIKLKSVREKGLRYLEDTIRRDQNHPSVFVWSVANELGARPTDNQNAYVAAADRLANRLDPSRLTSIDFAGYPGLPRPGIYRRLDILGGELLLRVVPGSRAARWPTAATSGRSSTRCTSPTPASRCSSRSSEPSRTAAARWTRRAPSSSRTTSWTSTCAPTTTSPTSAGRSRGSSVTSRSARSGTAATRSRTRRSTTRA